jgi:AcrR family transcriptional regulator
MTSAQRRSRERSVAPAQAELIAAVQRLLASAGVESLTSRAISEAAGTNLALITYYFGSKDNLVAEAMIATAQSLLDPVLTALGDPDPVAGLIRAAQELQRIVVAHRAELVPYVQCLATAAVNETVRDRYRTLYGDVCELLARIIAEQRASGALPAWVDPVPMAQLIGGLVNGVAAAAAIDPDNTNAPAIATQFVSLLLAVRAP